MKSFNFSMQGVLDLKDTLKTVSEINLSQAERLVQVEEETLDLLDRKIELVLEDADAKADDPAYFVRRTAYLEELRRKRFVQDNVVAKARHAAEEFRRDLVKAETELKKMQRVNERERSTWLDHVRRDDQRVSDEVAATMRHSFH